MNRPIIITGCSGFIGAYLAIRLTRNGYQVTATDIRPPSDTVRKLFDEVGLTQFRLGDLNEAAFVGSLIQPGIGVIHAAGTSRVSTARDDPPAAVRATLLATTILLEQMKNASVGWFILLGTREVERLDSPPPPQHLDDTYAILKRATEDVARCYCLTEKVPLLIFRLSDVYGSPLDHEQKLLPILIKRAQNGNTLQIHNQYTRSHFTHIDDVADAIFDGIRELDNSKIEYEVRNLWTQESTTPSELAELIVAMINSPSKIEQTAQTSWSGQKILPMSSWRFVPKVSLRGGLRRLLNLLDNTAGTER